MIKGEDSQHKKQAVEQRLNALRNANRLAIHVFEDPNSYAFPDVSFDALKSVHAEDIPARLIKSARLREGDTGGGLKRSATMPLLSMTLLNNDATKATMKPYEVREVTTNNLSYLVDLSQTKPHSAKVLRAELCSLGSGKSVYNKDFKLSSAFSNVIIDLYKGYDEAMLLRLAASDEGSNFTQEQLDTLAEYYEQYRSHLVVNYNEILVAASLQHVVAIAASLYETNTKNLLTMQLAAALEGLRHLKKGLDVPVVFYHVDTPYDEHKIAATAGSISYMGQGKEELTDIAIKTIRQLQKSNIYFVGDDIKKAAIVLLGIDMVKPINEQKAAVMRAKERAAASISSPPTR